jgi:hypothetical protein
MVTLVIVVFLNLRMSPVVDLVHQPGVDFGARAELGDDILDERRGVERIERLREAENSDSTSLKARRPRHIQR